jgi:hypothetical protein
VVPEQVLPPLIANVAAGAVLYTAYLQILARLHEGSSLATRRVYPPPAPIDTFAAGFLAGGIQSVLAAPLDAVHARYELGRSAAGMTGSGNPLTSVGAIGLTNGGLLARPQNMWAFGYDKLREIGMRGIFAGWGLSFLKDSFGNAIFFSVFEYLKAQSYYRFVTWYYGSLSEETVLQLSMRLLSREERSRVQAGNEEGMPRIIKPHYAIEPAFLLLAGVGASITQQVIVHPLSHIQVEHWERLEMLDAHARKIRHYCQSDNRWRWRMFGAYYAAYRETWTVCLREAEASGTGLRRWLYRGFWWNTIRQVPSTSAGLIIFELVRRKYGFGGDPVRINKDGYDIMLN